MNKQERLTYVAENWHKVHTLEPDVILLSIWIEENLGPETETMYGINSEGNDVYFEDEKDAMAFKLTWL